MPENNKTFVEWLIDELKKENLIRTDLKTTLGLIILKAEEKHKRETIKFGYDLFETILNKSELNTEGIIYTKLPEELYKETFKKD